MATHSPVVSGFRSDLRSEVATLTAASGVSPLTETRTHSQLSLATGLHAYVANEVPERAHDGPPGDPRETLADGGDSTERALLLLSLLASAGLPGRVVGVAGGPPHTTVEVALPAADREDVRDAVDAVVDVSSHNGGDVTAEDVHWRDSRRADAVFFPLCPSDAAYPGDVSGLAAEGYVDWYREEPATVGGEPGYGYSGGGWAYTCVLDPLACWYDTERARLWDTTVTPAELAGLLVTYLGYEPEPTGPGLTRLRRFLGSGGATEPPTADDEGPLTPPRSRQTVSLVNADGGSRLVVGGVALAVRADGGLAVERDDGPPTALPPPDAPGWYVAERDVTATFADEPAGSTPPAEPDEKARIERVLEHNGGSLKPAEIAAETGWPTGKVEALLAEMADAGRVDRRRVGRSQLVQLSDPGATNDTDGRGGNGTVCPQCGESLAPLPDPSYCPACGAALDP